LLLVFLSPLRSAFLFLRQEQIDLSDDPFVLTPGLAGRLYDNETYDWQFKTVSQVCYRFLANKLESVSVARKGSVIPASHASRR
jgi:hypothetical protein